jgi:nitrite reductase/ring-hydroxylating ferredoxin subunit
MMICAGCNNVNQSAFYTVKAKEGNIVCLFENHWYFTDDFEFYAHIVEFRADGTVYYLAAYDSFAGIQSVGRVEESVGKYEFVDEQYLITSHAAKEYGWNCSADEYKAEKDGAFLTLRGTGSEIIAYTIPTLQSTVISTTGYSTSYTPADSYETQELELTLVPFTHSAISINLILAFTGLGLITCLCLWWHFYTRTGFILGTNPFAVKILLSLLISIACLLVSFVVNHTMLEGLGISIPLLTIVLAIGSVGLYAAAFYGVTRFSKNVAIWSKAVDSVHKATLFFAIVVLVFHLARYLLYGNIFWANGMVVARIVNQIVHYRVDLILSVAESVFLVLGLVILGNQLAKAQSVSPAISFSSTVSPISAQIVKQSITPLRILFWGELLYLFDFNFGQTTNGKGFTFDILNDSVGAILIALAVFRLGAIPVHSRYTIVMKFVQVMAVLAVLLAILSDFTIPLSPMVLFLLSPFGLMHSVAIVALCVAMQWFCAEAHLFDASWRWLVTAVLWVVIDLIPTNALRISTAWAVTLDAPFNMDVEYIDLLPLLVFAASFIFLFVSISRMRGATEAVTLQSRVSEV